MHHACGITVKFLEIFRFRYNFSEVFGFRENFRDIFVRFSRKFSQQTKIFRETIFREISRKLTHLRLIFAFSRKLKNAFSFQPYFNADANTPVFYRCRISL
jgi:hypothetical protein